MINTEDFKQPLLSLLAEAFGVLETPSGFFLDTGQSGLIGTITNLSADVASATLRPGHETIASHCGHVLFLLNLFDQYERGQQPVPDWEASWATHSVDADAWSQLRADLQSAYTTAIGHLQARSEWPQPVLSAWMMLLAHCSYHVGVIHKLHTTIAS